MAIFISKTRLFGYVDYSEFVTHCGRRGCLAKEAQQLPFNSHLIAHFLHCNNASSSAASDCVLLEDSIVRHGFEKPATKTRDGGMCLGFRATLKLSGWLKFQDNLRLFRL